MSSNPDQDDDRQDDHHRPAQRDDWVQLIASMADTTWRMFTPPAIFVSAGLYADLKWHTGPWLTLLGAAVGLALSVMLVKKQLENGE